MKEAFNDKLNAMAAIAITMDENEIAQTIEILQRYKDAQKVHKTSELISDFIEKMREVAGNEDLPCLFIPQAVWEANNYVSDEEVNDERGKYFVLLPEFVEGTVDNMGTPILRVIDREKEEE